MYSSCTGRLLLEAEPVKESDNVTSQPKRDKFFMIYYSDYSLLFTDYY